MAKLAPTAVLGAVCQTGWSRDLRPTLAEDRGRRWTMGIMASYPKRLLLSARAFAQVLLRPAGAAAVLIFALALAPHAHGQTEPLVPAFAETTCELPGISPDIAPRLRCGTVGVPR